MSNKPNYVFKSVVISSGLDALQRSVSKSIFNNAQEHNFKFKYTCLEAQSINDYMNTFAEAEWHEAMLINHSSYARVKRLKSRVTNLLNKGTCIFATLTFTDDVLNSTSIDTRRQYVFRFLKSVSSDYVANIDFGKKNGREHYHAIILANKIDCKLYKYGAINVKKIHKSSNPIKLAKYISKLTNHAIKETTKRSAIIYSR